MPLIQRLVASALSCAFLVFAVACGQPPAAPREVPAAGVDAGLPDAGADAGAPPREEPPHVDGGLTTGIDGGPGDGGDLPTPPIPVAFAYDVTCGANTVVTLEELDSLALTTGCPDAVTQVEGLPAGAALTAGGLEWTPALDQAGHFSFTLVAGEARTTVSGMVLDRFDAADNVPVLDPTTYPEEYGLPVFHLSWHSDEPDYCLDAVRRDAVPADIVVNGVSYEGAELRCRGTTSLNFPMKSFNLKFSKESPFNGEGPLAAFTGRRRLSLTQTFDDNLTLRTRLGFELWNRLDPAHPAIDHASVVVFVDGRYQGVYQLTDKIDDHFLKLRGLDKSSNIYKGRTHEANLLSAYEGHPNEPLWVGYDKDEGEPEDDFSDLEALIRWVSDASDEDFAATVDQRIATDDFIDWYIMMFASFNGDAFGKNALLIHDTDGPDERFRFLPWDLNASFGQDWDSRRVQSDVGGGRLSPQVCGANGVWQRFAAIPALGERLDARFRAALHGPIAREPLIAWLEQEVETVRPAALRSERRWEVERRACTFWSDRDDFTTFDEESVYVRGWLDARWRYLETLWPAP